MSSKSSLIWGDFTIYMGNPEIHAGKTNGSGHSVWGASENMGYDLRDVIFPFFKICLADLDIYIYTLKQFVLLPHQIFQVYVYAQDFHQGGLCITKW